jgi:hypothetical protein
MIGFLTTLVVGLALLSVNAQSLTVTNGNFNTPWGSDPSTVMLTADVDTTCPTNVDITVTLHGDGVNKAQFAPGNWGPIYYPGDATKCAANGKCGATLSFFRSVGSSISTIKFSALENISPARDSQDRVIPGRMRYFVAIPTNLLQFTIQGGTHHPAVSTTNPRDFKATFTQQSVECVTN